MDEPFKNLINGMTINSSTFIQLTIRIIKQECNRRLVKLVFSINLVANSRFKKTEISI